MLHNKPQRTVNLNSMLLVKYTHRVIRHSFFNTIAHYDNDDNNNNNNNNNKANIYTG